MKIKLSHHQKEKLKELFIDSKVDFGFLFSRITHNLSNINIPVDSNNAVKAKDEANLMAEIAKTSLKLNKLISRLNEKQNYSVGYVLANQILEKYSLVETDKHYQNADAIEMTKRLHLHCDFQSKFIKGRYGRGKWDQTIDAVCHAWPIELGTELKITLNCKLVQFFSIILEESSHEKILKYIKRSPWYYQHFIADTSWQDDH